MSSPQDPREDALVRAYLRQHGLLHNDEVQAPAPAEDESFEPSPLPPAAGSIEPLSDEDAAAVEAYVARFFPHVRR